jgi:hypothetical protein
MLPEPHAFARARTVTIGVAVCWMALALPAAAQVPADAADSLDHAVARLTARLDSLEAGQCGDPPHPVALPGPTGDRAPTHRGAIGALSRRLAARPSVARSWAPPVGRGRRRNDDPAANRAAPRGRRCHPHPAADTTLRHRPGSSAGMNASALNPEISVNGDVRLVTREGRQRDNGVAREFSSPPVGLDPYSNTKVFLTFEDEEIGVGGLPSTDRLPGRLRLDVASSAAGRRLEPLAPPRAARAEYPLVYQLPGREARRYRPVLYTACPCRSPAVPRAVGQA